MHITPAHSAETICTHTRDDTDSSTEDHLVLGPAQILLGYVFILYILNVEADRGATDAAGAV